jgi:membrane glycosyltransferase
MPKLFALFLLATKGEARRFGGVLRLFLGLVGEVLFSALFAPIRMLFHSKFVFLNLIGRQVGWGPQQRDDSGTPWREAVRFHGGGTILAFLWAGALFLINRSFFWWISPIFIPILLSIPLSVLSSRASVGRVLRKLGLFLIPEETAPPPELDALHRSLYLQQVSRLSRRTRPQPGFERVVIDPWVNSLHLSLLRKKRKVSEAITLRRQKLQEKALLLGPNRLSHREKKELLYDPVALHQLHQKIWESPDHAVAEKWGIPL